MSSSARLTTDDPPPALSDADPHSRLVLLPDTDEHPPHGEYDAEEEDEDEDEDDEPPPGTHQAPLPPLPPSDVFLYLFSPYLRLGAMSASDVGDASLARGLTGLVVAASLSAFCRQIWFFLGRYLRMSFTQDILIHAFARRRRRSRKYSLARHTLSTISCSFRLLLAAMYLRDSAHAALLLKVPESVLLRSRLEISILLSVLVFVLSLPKSLAARRIVYTTGLSVASYLAWLAVVSRSYGTNNASPPHLSTAPRGVLWNEISSLVFACTTTMTVPLSASLTAGTPSIPPASRNTRARSFELLNVLSTILAVLFMFPLVIISAFPRAPASEATTDNLVLCLRIATLVSSIPSVVVSITSLPFHGVAYRFIRTDFALSAIIATVLALSLIPPSVASILDDATLFLAIFGTFLLPALAHITIHYFRRPLSIVVSHEPSSVQGTPCLPNSELSPSPSHDPLLQRKERLLQRSRFGKRLFWDIIVWIVLIPMCVCAFVWATGRLARQW